MYDKDAMTRLLKSRGVKLRVIAEKLGVTEATFRNKRKGKTEFTQTEISEFCDCLRLSDSERNSVFFA